MTINAYEKIKKTLVDTCSDFGFQMFDLSNSIFQNTNQWMLETGYIKEITDFLKKYPDAKVSVQNYVFDSGLELFYIQYLYRNKKNQLSIKRKITFVHDNQTLVHILFRSKRKIYLNILQDLEENHSFFPIGEKTVEICEVEVSVNHVCTSSFTSYRNLSDCTLLQEEYSQGSTLEKNNDSKSLDSNDRLTVQYKNQKPVSAQLKGQLLLEDFGYDSYSEEDALEVVKAVQKEVDAICEKIKSTICNHIKMGECVQKRIGTNPQ